MERGSRSSLSYAIIVLAHLKLMPILQKTERYSSRNHKAKSQKALNTLGSFFTKTTGNIETYYFSGTFIKVSFDDNNYNLCLYDSHKDSYNLILSIDRSAMSITLHSGSRHDKQGNVTDETKEFINAYMHELEHRLNIARIRSFRERLGPNDIKSWLDVDSMLYPFDKVNSAYTFSFVYR